MTPADTGQMPDQPRRGQAADRHSGTRTTRVFLSYAQADVPAERELYGALVEAGFDGEIWDRFASGLVDYAWPMLAHWISDGSIFRRCSDRGYRVHSLGRELQAVDIEDLTQDTLAGALRVFKVRALEQGRWRPEGNASLKTWFLTSCLYQFPNSWRSWNRTNRHLTPLDVYPSTEDMIPLNALPPSSTQDPERLMIEKDTVARILKAVPDHQTRKILLLRMKGYTFQEISDIINSTVPGMSASFSGRAIHLRDLATGVSHRQHDALGGGVITALALGGHDDHRAMVYGDSRGVVRIWSWDRARRRYPQTIRQPNRITAVALGYLGGRHVAISATERGPVKLWDIASGGEVHDTKMRISHENYLLADVGALAVSETSSGQAVAVTTSRDDDGRLFLWDLSSGRKLRDYPRCSTKINAVTITAIDHSLFAIGGCADGTVVSWNLLKGEAGRTLGQLGGEVTAMAQGRFHGNPVVLSACADGTVRTLDLGPGEGHEVLTNRHRDHVSALAVGTPADHLTPRAVEGRLRRLRQRLGPV